MFKNIFNFPRNLAASKALLDKDFQNKLTKKNQQLESMHSAEVLIVIEHRHSIIDYFNRKNSSQRALDLFSIYRVWDTSRNHGVLIYLSISNHHFEIIADRGIGQKINNQQWQEICDSAIKLFEAGEYQKAMEQAIDDVGKLLIKYFKSSKTEKNELNDKPIFV